MPTSLEPLLVATFAMCVGSAVAVGTWGVISAVVAHSGEGRLRQRLRTEEFGFDRRQSLLSRLLDQIVHLGERIAAPFVDEESSAKEKLRRELVKAGIYSANAVKLVIGARVFLLFGGLLAGYLAALALASDTFLGAAVGGIGGYLAPKLWLSRRVRSNHLLLERALPDALDLMVVCVEAGLTIDAAMQRVSEELQLAHPALSRELSICHMETRIGLPRAQAMQNLGTRSGYAPLKALTAMLVQADRFGTSIANALRIQAESMRVARQHRAEETAAKASVKLSFPLVLFIFPATFIVLAGPMIISFMANGLGF